MCFSHTIEYKDSISILLLNKCHYVHLEKNPSIIIGHIIILGFLIGYIKSLEKLIKNHEVKKSDRIAEGTFAEVFLYINK